MEESTYLLLVIRRRNALDFLTVVLTTSEYTVPSTAAKTTGVKISVKKMGCTKGDKKIHNYTHSKGYGVEDDPLSFVQLYVNFLATPPIGFVHVCQ